MNPSGHEVVGSEEPLMGISGRFRSWMALCRAHPLLCLFALLAIVERIGFHLATHRIWEDALITLTPARNAWDGFGLTHHASEPRVHSFTSAISVLIPLVGESVRQGLALLLAASLIASVATIVYAYRVGLRLRFPWWAQVLVLGYLSTDQLQVFFGITGMETQIATAVALANLFYLQSARWWSLGFAVGLGLLCRPEFVIWVAVLAVAAPFLFWRQTYKVAVGATLVYGPWFMFATLYYGSPIPHTIVAKSSSGHNVFGAFPLHAVMDRVVEGWKDFSPFYEMASASQAPVNNVILIEIVLLLALTFLLGVFRAIKNRDVPLLSAAAFVIIFLVYRFGTLVPNYFMWYLPPFMALAVVLAGYGMQGIRPLTGIVAPVACIGLVLAYALPLPWSIPLERWVQGDIENGVRLKASYDLNGMMGPEDTAAMEPLGYTGWAARNKTIYDFPGLGSKIAVATLKDMRPYPSLTGLIDRLRPNYLLLRPRERLELETRFPQTFDQYRLVDKIEAPNNDWFRTFYGYRYQSSDHEFDIFKRQG